MKSKINSKLSKALSQKQRLSLRLFFLYGCSSAMLFVIVFYFYFQLMPHNLSAAVTGDYRTKATGTWGLASTWERYNGVMWIDALAAPTSADGVIEIQTGHIVFVSANVTVDQVIVDAGGKVSLTSGTLTVAKGSGTDLTVNGDLDIISTLAFNGSTIAAINGTSVLKSTGTITLAAGSKININNNGIFVREGGTMPTGSGFITVASGGKFQHAMNGGTLPTATWSVGSSCEISGVTNTIPSGITQNFQNFIWNCAGQNTSINFAGALQNVKGDLTMANSGTGLVFFDYQGNNTSLIVGGNFFIKGGTTYLCVNGNTSVTLSSGDIIVSGGAFNFNQAGGTAYGNLSATVYLTGNLTITGGVVDMSMSTANNSSKGLGTIYISGNLSVTGSGVITESSSSAKGIIYFNGTTATQNFVSNRNITNMIDYNVNTGAILNMDSCIATGTGTFTLNTGAGLILAHSGGIAKTAMDGNVQTTGVRSFSTGSDYTYNGRSAQISGNALPSLVRSLTLNNSYNCTLTASTTISSTADFIAGIWIALDDTLTLGTTSSNLGILSRTSGHVYGYFRRWIAATATSNILFPVGSLNYYNGVNVSFTSPPTAGSIVSSYIVANPGSNGLPLTDAGEVCSNIAFGYWSFGAMNGFVGGTFNVNAFCNGVPNVNDYTRIHLLRRVNGASPWTTNGTFVAGTGSNASFSANRNGMTLLGHYGITSSSANPLPIQLVSFDAKKENKIVRLFWMTASETNNDYFSVERSTNGNEFKQIAKVKGAGNSTIVKVYAAEDLDPKEGFSYYRLKQTDYDGGFTYSKTVAIKFSLVDMVQDNQPITIDQVFPIPFSDQFTVKYFNNTNTKSITISLINMEGKLFYDQTVNAKKGVNYFSFDNGSDLLPGNYIISISDDSYSVSKKIIK